MNKEDETVYYFAYGSNSNSEMIKAITGRKPKGFSYELKGYELCIQTWKDIPKKAQAILSRWWDKSFRSYSLRKNSAKSVAGKVWKLTQKERDLVGNWELHNIWYKPIKIKKKINNKPIKLETELIRHGKMNPVQNSKNYPYFLVDKNKILMVARAVRKVN